LEQLVQWHWGQTKGEWKGGSTRTMGPPKDMWGKVYNLGLFRAKKKSTMRIRKIRTRKCDGWGKCGR